MTLLTEFQGALGIDFDSRPSKADARPRPIRAAIHHDDRVYVTFALTVGNEGFECLRKY